MGNRDGFPLAGLLNFLKAGVLVGSRTQVNFIEGANIGITVADNPGANREDVTIATHWGVIAAVPLI
jgi:hypothetical protein